MAGVVVLYNPDSSVPENLKTYIDSTGRMYAVDNSDKPDEKVISTIREFENLTYVPLNGNKGIAAALNTAARMASEAGYEWLLTMDQDTRASTDIVRIMLTSLAIYPKSSIGIISSRYTPKNVYVKRKGSDFNEMMATITSGNLLNLDAYKKTGPYLEKLFIDQVDHEYCMRLGKKGYKIIQANHAVLDHRMGEKKAHMIGYCSHYNPMRRYFITRNRLYVARLYLKEYPWFACYELLTFLKEIIKILLYEDKKNEKFRSIILGILDFLNNKFDRDLVDLEPEKR